MSWLRGCLFASLMLQVPSLHADSAELQALNESLQQLETTMANDQRALQTVSKTLKNTEQALRLQRQQLSKLHEQYSSSTRSVDAASTEKKRHASITATLKKQLAAHLRQQWMSNHSGPQPGLLHYFDGLGGQQQVLAGYLTQAQSTQIKTALVALTTLEQQYQALVNAHETIASLKRAQAKQTESQATQAKQQQAKAKQLRSLLKQQQSEHQQLKQQADELTEVLKQLARQRSSAKVINAPSLVKQKGLLPWPVQGEVIQSFGKARKNTQLNWQGWLFRVSEGQPVQTVAAGRVVYADWLSGLGLLVVVEHDQDHLSLYGHNQTILPNVGQWVEQGETIATTGRSGGQLSPQLYFEIRAGKKPQNPSAWLQSP